MLITPEQQAFSYFLPDNTLRYFEIVSSSKTDKDIKVTLEEKNDPPLEERHLELPVLSKGFQDITITDFPVRGRKTELTFRRRRWLVGAETLKRDIDLRSSGTQLEKEFGFFLKDNG